MTVLDHDIEVFSDIELTDKVGVLRKGSVVNFSKWNMLKKGKMAIAFVFNSESKTLFFSTTEFPVVSKVLESTSYRIRDKNIVRTVAGKEIFVNSGISKNEKGQLYVEMLNNIFLKKLPILFWELTGDYYFDNEGNFLRVGFEPYFGA